MTDDVTGTDPTRPSGGRSWRIPLLVGAAVLAIVVVVAIAVGGDNDDDEGEPSADSATESTSSTPSPSASDSGSPSASPSASDSPSAGDPTPSPIINKAVKAAMKDDFPALVPAGVPAGWTVVSAAYDDAAGGTWRIDLTDPTGAEVVLVQSKASAEQLVRRHLGGDAQATGKVDLKDFGTGVWTGYASSAGAGIAKKISDTTALVYGPDQDTVVTLAQELLTAEDADLPEAG